MTESSPSPFLKSVFYRVARFFPFGKVAALAAHTGRFSLITQIEEHTDCWGWEADGIQYWPLVRTELRRHLMKPLSAPPPPNVDAEDSSETASERAPGKQSEAEVLAHWHAVFETVAQADILFLSRFEDNNQRIDDKRHDRMIDPIMRFTSAQGLTTGKAIVARKPTAAPTDLAIEGPVFFVDDKNDLDAPTAMLPPLSALIDILREFDPSLQEKTFGLRSLVKRTRQRALVFGCLLDQIKPKIVFLATFDDPIQMAMTLACHRRGIKVVDVQHGKQGVEHLLGIEWANMPASPAPLLPDFFWVWNSATEKRVAWSLGAGCQFHRPIAGGNLWLNEWTAGGLTGGQRTRAFSDSFGAGARKLLLCLQPIADPFPPALLEAMKASPKEWVWWVRLHPKQLSKQDDFAALLSEQDIRFEIAQASALPLYLLLAEAECHLTAWSTVAFEADALGVPTVLFHPKALDILSDEIAEGRFSYAGSATQIIDQVRNALNPDHQATRNRPDPAIVFDRQSAERSLSFISQYPAPSPLAERPDTDCASEPK